ncbi:MAG: glutamate racemase [Chitinophagaceae bacterium]
MQTKGAIGVFDSGYGGLTILKEMVGLLPQYDYCYLGDNARSPYGNRSFETVYHYTLQCVDWFFKQGCSLVILACNTASAKALRTIQQTNLWAYGPNKRVLGVIRPTAEVLGKFSSTNEVGILATSGTVSSESYIIELNKFFPQVKVYQQACPLWVPLIENNEHLQAGADFFVQKYLQQLLQQSTSIDTILLGCTHYPLLLPKINNYLQSKDIKVIPQGEIVANSLADYLQRHPEIAQLCSTTGKRSFFTTDDADSFNQKAALFFGEKLTAQTILLD